MSVRATGGTGGPAAAAFLLDATRARFVSGTDLLVDGGTVAGVSASGMLG